MAFTCLPKEKADELIQAIKDGRFDYDEMVRSGSAERAQYLEQIVGEQYAKDVNVLLERKILLKDWKAGMTRAVQSLTIEKPVKDAYIEKIMGLEKILDKTEQNTFLTELAERKLRYGVTYAEASYITELARKVKESGEKMNEALKVGKEIDPALRKQYGIDDIMLQEYVNYLKLKPRGTKNYWKDKVTDPNKIKSIIDISKDVIMIVGSTTKGAKATLDVSAVGRQGYKLMTNNPIVWAKGALTIPKNMFKEIFTNKDVMFDIRAEIVSRDNAVNGKYQAMKADVGLRSEEAFPDSIWNKIPGMVDAAGLWKGKPLVVKLVTWPVKLGAEGVTRVYKAFETAYTGTILRWRADYADLLIKQAEKNGVNMLDTKQAQPIGRVVNEMTGRGHLRMGPEASKLTNVALFSPRWWKSQVDFLTAHQFDLAGMESNPGTLFAKKKAAANLTRSVLATASILYTASQLWGEDAVETDMTSTDFGRIRINDTRFDVTAGHAAHLVLAMRVYKGQSKSATTGKITDLRANGWGRNTVDVVEDYIEGKSSPSLRTQLEWMAGEHFNGDPVTMKSAAQNLLIPIPVTTYEELRDNPEAADLMWAMMFESLGVSTNTY